MNYDDVLKKFKFLSGLQKDEMSEWVPLLYDSMFDISSRISTDCSADAYSRQLSSAAAALANYKYRRILGSRGGDAQIKAGDVAITPDEGTVAKAYSIYVDSLESIADILVDDEFYFKGVDGLYIPEQ